jgi:hypothetical protein
LYICVPQYGRPIEGDYFQDELPEDGDVPDVIQAAMVALMVDGYVLPEFPAMMTKLSDMV